MKLGTGKKTFFVSCKRVSNDNRGDMILPRPTAKRHQTTVSSLFTSIFTSSAVNQKKSFGLLFKLLDWCFTHCSRKTAVLLYGREARKRFKVKKNFISSFIACWLLCVSYIMIVDIMVFFAMFRNISRQ